MHEERSIALAACIKTHQEVRTPSPLGAIRLRTKRLHVDLSTAKERRRWKNTPTGPTQPTLRQALFSEPTREAYCNSFRSNMASQWFSFSYKYCNLGKHRITGLRKQNHGFSFIQYVLKILNKSPNSHWSGLSLTSSHLTVNSEQPSSEMTNSGGHVDRLRLGGPKSLTEECQEPGSSGCLSHTLNRGGSHCIQLTWRWLHTDR